MSEAGFDDPDEIDKKDRELLQGSRHKPERITLKRRNRTLLVGIRRERSEKVSPAFL